MAFLNKSFSTAFRSLSLSTPRSLTARSIYTEKVLTTRDRKLFDKILIANRGEIARRIIRTCKRLGIKTVAVHSTPDAKSPYVREADEAVHLPGVLSAETYLVMDNIIDAAKKTGAQAIHPGYGFLSENAKFVSRLEKEGIVFIGPPSTAIAAMGDKIESKKLAQKAGVNIIPGKLADIKDADEAVKIAREIGYPVMIKAASGGGGKGMRIAWNDKEAVEGFRLARDEAKSAFASDRILVEKFIDQPRHVEVQVFSDGQTALFLNERECSIQRRNQKVLEEAPSPFVDPETRAQMGRQATQLAAAVGYRTAGTVEMLMDGQRNFYFLEMNTRLQVEHPVSEMITGFDLVELMIRIAAGERLVIGQKDVPLNGWSMEARVYAEDPFRNFLPSIGYLERYVEPPHEHIDPAYPNIRVESALMEGNQISMFYDPMIAKVVVWGENRAASIQALKKTLDSYVVRLGSGGNHNIAFLRAILEKQRYKDGRMTTAFIPEEWPEGFKGHPLTQKERTQLAATAAIIDLIRRQRDGTSSDVTDSFQQIGGLDLVVSVPEFDIPVTVREADEPNAYVVEINHNGTETITIRTNYQPEGIIFDALVGEEEIVIQYTGRISEGYRLQHVGTNYDVKVRTPRQFELSKHMPVKSAAALDTNLLSPMPGRIVSVNAKPGQRVLLGEELLCIEAMKMRNILRAPQDCVVKSVNVVVGKDVAVDEVLVEFDLPSKEAKK